MPAVIDPKKCTGTGTCVGECPTEAISMVQNKAKVDPDQCTNCEACVSVCPEGAISMAD